MATASEAVLIARESSWINRVAFWRLAASIDVMSEDAQIANHAERVTYANLVIAGAEESETYALAVATNDTIRANLSPSEGPPEWSIPDNDMEFTVNSLFNAFAGVST